MLLIDGILDTSDLTRQTYTAYRWAVLYGRHRDLVERHIQRSLGVQRADAIGDPDLSVNLLAQVCQWMAVSYLNPPVHWRTDGDVAAAEALAPVLDSSGIWGLMRRVNRDTMALRECLVRVSVDGRNEVCARPAWPQHIRAWAYHDRPDVASTVWERREYRVDGRDSKCWEVWDISLPNLPYARVHLAGDAGDTLGRDVTEEVWGQRYEGEGYPWRLDTGEPILPYAWYHATAPDGLWEPYEWDSLFRATLEVCKLRSYFVHVIQTASWRQRYMIALNVVGAQQASGDVSVPMDPANVLVLTPSDDAGNGTPGQVGSFEQPSDPQIIIQAIRTYMHDAVSSTGLPASDLMRTGNDPVSGVSLAISREAQREVQAQYVPTFERGDQDLLTIFAVAAKLSGVAVPCDRAWRTTHQSLSLSTDERIRRSAYVKDAQAQMLMGKVQAYMFLNPGATVHQAERAVEELARPESTRVTSAAEAGDALLGKTNELLDEGRVYEAIAVVRGAVEAEATQAATAAAEGATNE